MNEALPTAPAPAATADRPAAAAGKIGVLLVNLGTPEAADGAAVRRYLKEFLTDPRVIEDQGALWQLVLNGIILPIRPRRKARDYAKIWNHEKNESPLKTITRSQAEKLARALEPLGSQVVVDWAMRYGLASFHGVPKAYVDNGDPYYAHCIETVRLLRERLNLDQSKLTMTFQSRFGRGKWLEPATNLTLKKLAKSGVKNVAVVMPGFSADCLETLEEIAVEGARI